MHAYQFKVFRYYSYSTKFSRPFLQSASASSTAPPGAFCSSFCCFSLRTSMILVSELIGMNGKGCFSLFDGIYI